MTALPLLPLLNSYRCHKGLDLAPSCTISPVGTTSISTESMPACRSWYSHCDLLTYTQDRLRSNATRIQVHRKVALFALQYWWDCRNYPPPYMPITATRVIKIYICIHPVCHNHKVYTTLQDWKGAFIIDISFHLGISQQTSRRFPLINRMHQVGVPWK